MPNDRKYRLGDNARIDIDDDPVETGEGLETEATYGGRSDDPPQSIYGLESLSDPAAGAAVGGAEGMIKDFRRWMKRPGGDLTPPADTFIVSPETMRRLKLEGSWGALQEPDLGSPPRPTLLYGVRLSEHAYCPDNRAIAMHKGKVVGIIDLSPQAPTTA